jgi:hypothetical protein
VTEEVDDGSVQMVIRLEDSKVVQRFERPMLFVKYDPRNAVDIAKALTGLAFEADTGLKPVGETLKADLVQKHRDVLIPRISLMLNSLREDKLKSNGQIALSIMDAVCGEVFRA